MTKREKKTYATHSIDKSLWNSDIIKVKLNILSIHMWLVLPLCFKLLLFLLEFVFFSASPQFPKLTLTTISLIRQLHAKIPNTLYLNNNIYLAKIVSSSFVRWSFHAKCAHSHIKSIYVYFVKNFPPFETDKLGKLHSNCLHYLKMMDENGAWYCW